MGAKVQFSVQLVHYFLERQLVSAKKWETWYKIQGRVMRFSMKEFALVIGMNCNDVERSDDNRDKQAIRDVFGVDKMTVGDLLVRYNVAKMSETNPMKRFKLALLVLIEDVLLGGDKKRKVRGWVVRLLQDVDDFLNYPWGRIVYEATHGSLIGAIENRIALGVKGDHERNNYNLHGFPLAFQVRSFKQ